MGGGGGGGGRGVIEGKERHQCDHMYTYFFRLQLSLTLSPSSAAFN